MAKPSNPSEIVCLHPLNQRPPPKPLDPEVAKTITAEVWVEMVAAAPTHSSGYVNAAQPPPKPPDLEATMTIAVKALAEMVTTK